MHKRRAERRQEGQFGVELKTGSYTMSMGLDSILRANGEIWCHVLCAHVCAGDITRFDFSFFFRAGWRMYIREV